MERYGPSLSWLRVSTRLARSDEGGIRFHPDETSIRAPLALDDLEDVGRNTPGGGKGDHLQPERDGPGELERLSRAYVRQVGRVPAVRTFRADSTRRRKSWPG